MEAIKMNKSKIIINVALAFISFSAKDSLYISLTPFRYLYYNIINKKIAYILYTLPLEKCRQSVIKCMQWIQNVSIENTVDPLPIGRKEIL